MWRCSIVVGGHGGSVQQNTSRTSHSVADHKCACFCFAGYVPRGGREARHGLEKDIRHIAERHFEGVHRTEGMDLSHSPGHEARGGYV